MSWKMYRLLLAAVVLVLGVSSLTLAQGSDEQEGKVVAVKLKDGRTIQGVVTKKDDGMEVKTAGGVLKFQESEIESITPVVSAKDAYLAKRDETNLKNPESLYQLAQWVWENHQRDAVLLNHARGDLQAALDIDKNYTPAKLLLRQVDAKIKILASAAAPTAGNRPVTGETLAVEDRDLVTKQDIYWIRLQELRPTDRVMIQYENKVLQRYIDSMRGKPIDKWDRYGKEQEFLRLPRSVQVMEILRNKPNDLQLLQDIHVMRDPKFMTDFRSQVWPVLQTNCAKSNCHGGPTPNGGLKFFVVPGTNPKVDYTNYLIVSGWKKGNDGKERLLDRQDIEASLILQYGLNTKVSQKPHPFNIPPVFTGTRSQNYRRVYRWMSSLKKPMAPNYYIHAGFQPAGMSLDTTGLPVMADDDVDEDEVEETKPSEKK